MRCVSYLVPIKLIERSLFSEWENEETVDLRKLTEMAGEAIRMRFHFLPNLDQPGFAILLCKGNIFVPLRSFAPYFESRDALFN